MKIIKYMLSFALISIGTKIIINAPNMFPNTKIDFVIYVILSITFLVGLFMGLWEMSHDR